jgi:hypothetical protein
LKGLCTIADGDSERLFGCHLRRRDFIADFYFGKVVQKGERSACELRSGT